MADKTFHLFCHRYAPSPPNMCEKNHQASHLIICVVVWWSEVRGDGALMRNKYMCTLLCKKTAAAFSFYGYLQQPPS
jgi:hypothetical protein